MTVIEEERVVAVTADDAFLIRKSFDRLWAKKQFATAFYDRLFELAPETRLLLSRRPEAAAFEADDYGIGDCWHALTPLRCFDRLLQT